MSRLPTPGTDDGSWGDILNDFLLVEHNSDGTLRPTGSLASKYTKPAGGIPKQHLSNDVQEALTQATTTTVATLADTDLTQVDDNQILTFDASQQKWKNTALPVTPEATDVQKGIVQLSGDLGGTADSPSVKSRTVKATVHPTQGDFPVSSFPSASAAIQAALNTVGQDGGGEVYVSEGTYELTFTLNIPSYVTLRGSRSRKTVLRLADSVNGHIVTNSDNTNGNTCIGMAYLIIEGNGSNQSGGRGLYFKRLIRSRLENLELRDVNSDGIVLDNCKNIDTNRVVIDHAGGTGFLFTASSDCSLKNSEVSYNHVGVALASTSNHNAVSFNRIDHNELYSLLGGTAADTQFNSYNTFSHNIIEYGGDDALVLDHNPYTTCIGNQVRYCGGHAGDQGLPIDTSPNSIISGNIIEYNYADGIELKNASNYCTITGNISRNNSNPVVGGLRDGAGIVVRAGIVGCTITGNACYCDESPGSQRRGIILTGVGVDYNTVTGNVVYGNSINQIELSSNIGTHNTISNNSGANATNTNVLISKVADQPVRHTNSTTSNTIEVVPTGNTGSSRTKGALYVENSQNPGTGFGMYTTYGAGAVSPLVSLRNGDTAANNTWDFNPAIALWTNVTTQSALMIDQLNTLATSRAGIVVKSSVDQTNPNAYGLIAGQQQSTNSTSAVYWGDHAGTGIVYNGRGNGGVVFAADQNGNALGISIDRDTTNTNSTTGSMRILDTANATDGGSYTKTGTAFTVASGIIASSGTITDTSKVASFAQTNSGATSEAVSITNAGSGASLSVDSTALVVKGGKAGFGTTSPTANVDTIGSTTANAGLRIRQGVAPAAPNSGDIWQDGAHLYARLGTTTHQLDQQGSGSPSSTTKLISQTAHGLAVGSWVRFNGTGFVKAVASGLTTADVLGVVSNVADANTFTLTTNGFITGLSGLTPGSRYYLSPTTAGAITATEAVAGQVAKHVFFADSPTSGYVLILKSEIVTAGQSAVDWNPGDQSLIAWAFDPITAINASILPAAGVMYMARLAVPTATTVTNIIIDITAAGAGLTASGACIYQNGILLGQTADQSSAWMSTNTKTMPIAGGPVAVSAGYIYVAVWANGTTLPTLARANGRSNINVGTGATTYRFASAGSGITTTAPGTLGTMAASSISWWFAVN